MTPTTIMPSELAELCRQGQALELLDVRTQAEFQELHLTHARNVPLDQLDPRAVMHDRQGQGPLYVICRSGARGRQACERFRQAGFDCAVNVEGGTLACVQAGLPMVRGQAVMSLERQVRIAAGSLVVLGALLAWLVHPGFIALSGAVGAGLVFAGITDTCGMGLLLARMPWNRVSPGAATCAAGSSLQNHS
jgi:rhodanese-related sulfurtransferase